MITDDYFSPSSIYLAFSRWVLADFEIELCSVTAYTCVHTRADQHCKCSLGYYQRGSV